MEEKGEKVQPHLLREGAQAFEPVEPIVLQRKSVPDRGVPAGKGEA